MADEVREIGASTAAKRLGITPQMVAYYARQGRIGKMIEKRWLFSEAELAAFERTRKRIGNRLGRNANWYRKQRVS